MIKKRFLNYKHYSSFIRDLNDNLISKDAIVFVQDESHTCIWTHDKEYKCNVSKSNLEEGTLVFGDGYGSNVFTIQLDGETITLTDSDGNSYSVNYVLKSLYNKKIREIEKSLQDGLDGKPDFDYIEKYYLLKSDFLDADIQPLLKQGRYISIADDNTIDWTLDMDTSLSPTSTNPVENKAVYAALEDKANKDEVLYPKDIANKQDKLKAGSGIKIQNNVISSTLDTEVYVILTQDQFPPINPSENKIYLVQVANGDGTFRYILYIYRNNQWYSTDQIIPEVTISGYLTKSEADGYYQLKGQYILIGDVQDYCNINIIPLFNNYYTKQWIEEHYQLKPDNDEFATKKWCIDKFVLRDEVYTPKQGDLGTNIEGEEMLIIPGTGYVNITVDRVLSTVSENPVQNKVVTLALNGKVDTSTLSSYATKKYVTDQIGQLHLESYVLNDSFESALALKQDTLLPGNGISIVNNVISSTLDTNVFAIVDQLPVTPLQNKIYILLTVDLNNRYLYTQYHWDGSLWILIGSVSPEVDLLPYLKSEVAAKTYQPIGDYILAGTLDNYVTNQVYVNDFNDLLNTYLPTNYQPKGTYATSNEIITKVNELRADVLSWLEDYAPKALLDYYVKWSSMYTPQDLQSGESSGDSVITPDTPTVTPGGNAQYVQITVDSELSHISENPVQNKVVAEALDAKLDKTSILNYVTNDYLTGRLNSKQDTLVAGTGIAISGNTISSTLDVNVFVVVTDLPQNPNPNKIYIHQIEENGTYVYILKRWDGAQWIVIGDTSVDVDLQPYLTTQTAELTYQHIISDLDEYVKLQDIIDYWDDNYSYVTASEFDIYKNTIDQIYQKIPTGDTFVTSTQLQSALLSLQQEVDRKYVLKKSVYEPTDVNDWESSTVTPIDIPENTLPSNNNSSGYIHIFLEQEQYENLSSYDTNTIYFVYEESEYSETWAFGDEFPVILS